MDRAFVYGMSVEGENFTDRVKETKRLKLDFENGVQALMAQCSGLFEQQIMGLTSYQLNFIRAICDGVHTDFGSKTILENYNLGTKSNITRIKTTLRDRELIDITQDGVFLEDPVFRMWIKKYNTIRP